MKDEGLDKIFQRHKRHQIAVSKAANTLNLKLFADAKHLSPSVTAIKMEEKIDAEQFRKTIKNKYNILLAGGQDHLKGKIFRIGHLGYIQDRDILLVISAIGSVLVDNNEISTKQLGEALEVASSHLEIT